MTFNEIFPEFIRSKKRQVKESTLNAYLGMWHTHLRDYFGPLNVEDIRNRHLQDFVDREIDEGRLSVKSIQDNVTLIKTILNWAQLRYELPVYPIKLIYPTCNKTMKEELDVYTQAEQRILIDYILEHPSHVNMSILMALTTGMRIGEVCGITYEDIDFLKHCVSVNKTIYRMVDYSRHDKGVRSSRIIINTPKTRSSQRVIPLSPVVAKWYKKSLDLYGHKSWYVASNAPKATEPRTMREHYKRLLKACGLRYIKFHGLRHTFASTLILNKTDPKTVAALMGHSSVDMTLNVYSHSTDEFKRKAVKSAFKI